MHYRLRPVEVTGVIDNNKFMALKAVWVLMTAASAATVLDGQVGRRKWPPLPAQLVGLEPQTTRAVLAFGGLGSTSVAQQAQEIRRILPDESAYWDYSTDRVSADELAVILRNQAQSLQLVSINGHSLGGPLGLEVVRRAHIPGLTLGRIVLHCSPFDARDTWHQAAIAASRVFRWPTGPASKFLFSLVHARLEHEPFRAAWKRARYDATSGCSPRLWLSQIGELRRLKLTSHLDEYRQLVGPATEAWYCMPADPSRDKTVNTEQAARRYATFFEALGVPFQVWRVPDIGHADVRKACNYIEKVFAAQGESPASPLLPGRASELS